MRLGQRIEQRRKQIGITQAELARRVGMPQSSMNSLINGDSRATKYLHKLVRELRTTPEYLSGEIDDPADGAPVEPALSSEQRELLQLHEAMDDASRRALMQVARSMGGEPPPKPTRHSPKLAYAGPPPRDK
jgi:transcriptional regulator with XRE-family HTH domain